MPRSSTIEPILTPFDMIPMRRSLMSPMGLSSSGCGPKSYTVTKKNSSKLSKRNHQRKTSPRFDRLIINPADVSRSSHKTSSKLAIEKARKR